MKLSDIKARFRRKQATGRHRIEPQHHYGPALVFLITAGLVGSAIVTAFAVQGNPEPVAAQYQPSYNPTPPPHVFPPAQPAPVTYTVVAGDSMWSIAYKKCGSGTRWTDLQHENSNDPWHIKPGQVLKLPAPACA